MKVRLKMLAKKVILALILTACLSVWAWADMGFQGGVTYNDCTCNMGHWQDKVKIWQAGAGPWRYNIHCSYGHPYTTLADTFAPGWYYLCVEFADISDCDVCFVQYVYHPSGTGYQTVNLIVQGPSGDPTGGGGD